MSLVTRSTKRRREYPRAFDHEEAQALYVAGATYGELADRYGVSYTAVLRVCDPAVRERMRKQSIQWARDNKRVPCKTGCGAMVWTHGRSGLCPSCYGERRVVDDVRDGELRCTKCREWKSDDEFARGKCKTRRGLRNWCRVCDATARRARRGAKGGAA